MISIQSEHLKVIVSEKGAEICSVKNLDGVEFIWQAAADVWPRHAPILFPIVGRVANDHYYVGENEFKLSQHGFARDKKFTLANSTDHSCTLELCDDSQTKINYPYSFILSVTHTVVGNTLHTHYEVTNPSPEPIYFSIGAHPAFSCELSENENINDFVIEFKETPLMQTVLKEGLRTQHKKKLELEKGKLQLSDTTFSNDALVFENNQINKLTLKSKKSGHAITLLCENWPYFGIWSKKECRNFVCLEPWYGITDKVNADGNFLNREGTLKLSPGEAFKCGFTLIFS